MIAALLAAGGGALAYGAGSVLQAVGARRAVARGHGVIGVARQAPYLIGLGCDLVGWLASLVALRVLPVFAVQAILAGSLAVTVLLAAATIGATLRGVDLAASASSVAALVVLGAAGGAERPRPVSHAVEIALVVGVAGIAIATAAAARWATPVATGAMSGAAFGFAALAARAVHARANLAGVLTEPLALAVGAYGITGMLGYAHGLEHGDVGPVTAALWVSETVVPGAIGLAVLSDRIRAGWAAPAALAAVVAVGSTVVLARSAARATAVPER